MDKIREALRQQQMTEILNGDADRNKPRKLTAKDTMDHAMDAMLKTSTGRLKAEIKRKLKK